MFISTRKSLIAIAVTSIISTSAFAGDNNEITIDQKTVISGVGTESQIASAEGQIASSAQIGSYNSSNINQIGDGQATTVVQIGTENISEVQSTGYGNT